MTAQKMARFLAITSSFAALLVSGCLNEEATMAPTDGSVQASAISTDPRIAFLVNDMGVPESMVSVAVDSISSSVRKTKKDTAYLITPQRTKKQKERNVKVNSFGFRAAVLDAMSKKAAALRASQDSARAAASASVGGISMDELLGSSLGKKSHTRWDSWSSLFDVKKLTEVTNIKVYIYTSGSAALGPNWQAAVRAAITAWNAQAKGTAISFSETSNASNHDISFRGSYGIGPDGSNTSTAYLTPDELVEPDGISLWVNTGYEHPGVPHNQKTTVAMSLLAMSTNFGFTGMEGLYWSMGSLLNISGTPIYDGDPWTPGSSILTYGTTSYSTPVMTAYDLRAFRTLYPTHGITAALNGGSLLTTAYENTSVVATGTTKQWVAGDTLYYINSSGYLYRRIGLGSSSTQLWPATGSNGSAEHFAFSNGYMAVRTTSGNLFMKAPSSAWMGQVYIGTSGDNFALDNNRLVYIYNAGGPKNVYSRYFTSGGSYSQVLEFSGSSSLPAVKARNGSIVLIDNGNVWMKPAGGYWLTAHYSWDGPASRLYVSDNLLVMYYRPPGYSTDAIAVQPQWPYGSWSYFPMVPMTNSNDVDVCGDKVAFLQTGAHLRVMNFNTWMVYEHYTLSGHFNISKVRLTGDNCDYVSIIDPSGYLWSKYGEDLNTDYVSYTMSAASLPMKF